MGQGAWQSEEQPKETKCNYCFEDHYHFPIFPRASSALIRTSLTSSFKASIRDSTAGSPIFTRASAANSGAGIYAYLYPVFSNPGSSLRYGKGLLPPEHRLFCQELLLPALGLPNPYPLKP